MNQTPTQKRHAFKKDIDKMMSNDYVLVPIKLTDEMLNIATTIFNATPHGTPADIIIEKIWANMMLQSMTEQVDEMQMP